MNNKKDISVYFLDNISITNARDGYNKKLKDIFRSFLNKINTALATIKDTSIKNLYIYNQINYIEFGINNTYIGRIQITAENGELCLKFHNNHVILPLNYDNKLEALYFYLPVEDDFHAGIKNIPSVVIKPTKSICLHSSNEEVIDFIKDLVFSMNVLMCNTTNSCTIKNAYNLYNTYSFK